MKQVLTVILSLCLFTATADEPFRAVRAIVGRLAGGYDGAASEGRDRARAAAACARFDFVRDASLPPGAATVGPGENPGTIRIAARDASGASYGLGQYVRQTQRGHVSWCGNRIPAHWPVPAATTTYVPPVRVRLAYNYCTLSYTMAFWSAAEWREEIDRLALMGFNVALVLNGLPAVWRETLRSVRTADGGPAFSEAEIAAMMTDEAALAWWHMGNLEGLGGPLDAARIDADAKLGRWIYAEMRQLGVEPMLQSFVGLMPYAAWNPGLLKAGVPRNPEVRRKYATYGDDPALAWKYLGNWCGVFRRPPILMPTSAAFDDLSDAWYDALARVYDMDRAGCARFVCGDLFHECADSGLPADALKAAGRKVQRMQQKHFGDSVTWMLQAWQVNESQRNVIRGLDSSRILVEVLDKNMGSDAPLRSDVRDGRGEIAPFVWTEVANFGGNTGLRGFDTRVRRLNHVKESQRAAFSGYGFLSEGFETNPLLYDMMLEQMSKRPNDPTTYLDDAARMASYLEGYRLRRYGYTDDNLRGAFETLLATAGHQKSRGPQEGCVENLLCANPGPRMSRWPVSSWGPQTGTEYAPARLFPAAEGFLAAADAKPALLKLETFRYDLVELFLQLLANRAREIADMCVESQAARDEFRVLLDRAERLTACDRRWRLDWHEARTRTTAGDAGAKGYRRMITTWTGNHDTARVSGLRDYAHRAYSGLIGGYYAPRWEGFFQLVEGRLTPAEYAAKLRALDDEIASAPLREVPAGNLRALAGEILRDLVRTAAPVSPTVEAVALEADPRGLVLVTEPGVTTWAGAGTRYATLEEGLAALRRLRKAHPGQIVRIWAVEENLEELRAVLPPGVKINSSPGGMYLTGFSD